MSVTNYKLEKQLSDLRSPGLLATIKDDDMLSYYTGLQNKVVFDNLLKLFEPHLPYLYSKTGNPRGAPREQSFSEEFLMVLMRLRLSLQEKDFFSKWKIDLLRSICDVRG